MTKVMFDGWNWMQTMPLLIELISNGTPEGHLYARGELMRLAKAVDENMSCSLPRDPDQENQK